MTVESHQHDSKEKPEPDQEASLEATAFLMETQDMLFVDAAGEAQSVASLVTGYQEWATTTGRVSMTEISRSRLIDRHAPAAEAFPFGPEGGPYYHRLDEPTGLKFAKALEDPEDALVREVEDEIVRKWRRYALFFGFMATVVGLLRIMIDRLAIDFLAVWVLTIAAAAIAGLSISIALAAYLTRHVTLEVRQRLQTQRACISAAAFRRTIEGEPLNTIGGVDNGGAA